MSLGRRLNGRSSAGIALADQWTMSGADRSVSIRTTSAISPTREQDTAGSGRPAQSFSIASRIRARILINKAIQFGKCTGVGER